MYDLGRRMLFLSKESLEKMQVLLIFLLKKGKIDGIVFVAPQEK